MNIRNRVLLIFFMLVCLGVMVISSYSIISVRDYLLSTSKDELNLQARYLAGLLVNQPDEGQFSVIMVDYAHYTNHQVELLDTDFHVILTAGTIRDTTAPTFLGIAALPGFPTESRQYVRITASGAGIQTTLNRVRYLIYGGILGVLLFTVLVSWVVADRVTLPIRKLASDSRRIADGEILVLPRSERRDEIGDLTRAVAAMASRLQSDILDLKRLNQAQEDFIAALSHEVRNPIFSARGYLEMALEECASGTWSKGKQKQLLDYLGKSHRNLLRIRDLFTDMLLLVRLEFDQEPMNLSMVSLGPLLSELEETFLPQAQERGLAFTIRTEPNTVRGNAEILKIVLANLVANAIRHTEQGEVLLDITLRDSDKVHFMVSDTGKGIPARHLESIFEKFYRIDKARDREQGGTGLGLALVKQCMRTMHTEIKVESEVGHGSRFWFELQAA